MRISELSIKRPILAFVINLIIVLAGILSYGLLPVREYPDVEIPVVSISTKYTGASPETIESTVTEPLEEALHGIEGIKSISSTSSKGQSTINVEFKPYRDIDDATTDINNIVQSALGKIPPSAEKPTIAKARANSAPIMWLSLESNNYSPEDLTNIADRLVKTPLQTLSGVGSIILGGARKYAMRIWLDPLKMAAHKVDANDIKETIVKNNLQLPAGEIEGKTRQFDILGDANIANPKDIASLVIRNENGSLVRIKDVAVVKLGSESYHTIAKYNGNRTAGIGIIKQSKANELKVATLVKNSLPKIKETLPPGIKLNVPYDSSIFVSESIKETKVALFIAFFLVVLVTYVFLRSSSPTSIITFVIPPSLIGTFIFMNSFGFSINVLTLLAFILAIGLVVDDAIVVLENSYRHLEMGKDKKQASLDGSREVVFPVLATSISLVAIFVPLSLMTGYTGRLFREFSIVVAIAVLLSSFVALTLTPMLCSKYLKVSNTKKSHLQFLENIISAMQENYTKGLNWALNHTRSIALFIALTFMLTIPLFIFVPKTSTPIEDRGMFVTFVKAPQGATLAYTDNTLVKVENEIKKVPEVKGFFSAIGLGIGKPPDTSEGFIFTRLKDWKERKIKQQHIVAMLLPKFFSLPGALVFAMNPLSLGQSPINKPVQFIIQNPSSSLDELSKVTNSILEKLQNVPGIVNLDTDLKISNPQLEIVFDRDKLADLGISASDVLNTFELFFSDARVNEFILENKQYDVIPSLAPQFKSNPNDISNVYIRSKDNEMIPLSNLIKIESKVAPSQINHYDLQRSVNISANLIPGFTLGHALREINKILSAELPQGYSKGFVGESREFEETKFEIYLTFAIALFFIFLVLSALFESFVHPITILVSVPLALLGAFGTLLASFNTLNIFSSIGIIMLVGLVTKNSILIVEYTNKLIESGKNIQEAVFDACSIRFRPILMTSLTMIIGTLPLAFAAGAGAESRQPLGLVIIGGLCFSTFFTLFITPVVYVLLNKLFKNRLKS